MSILHIASVVEGHGEVSALPVLLRRIAQLHGSYVEVLPPHRVPRSKVGKGEVGRAVFLQCAKLRERGAENCLIVILMDADDDDAPALEAALLSEVRDNLSCDVIAVVAVREYEAWFLSSITALRAHSSVRDNASYDGDPEVPRNAKGVLEGLMNESYQETLHQAGFSSMLDIDACSAACATFDRLRSEVVGRL